MTGKVFSVISKKPISFAYIYLEKYDIECYTNKDGKFYMEIPDSLVGRNAKMIAHKQHFLDGENVVSFSEDGYIEFFLYEDITLSSVVVMGAKVKKNAQDLELSNRTLYETSSDLSIASAIRGNAGAQIEDRGEGIIVRGGMGSETGFVFDGIQILDFFSRSAQGEGQQSRFPTSVFENINYSAGGFSSIYGQKMSAMVSLESPRNPTLPQNTEINLSSIYQNIDFSKQLGSSSLWGGASYSNLNLTDELFHNDRSYMRFTKAPEAMSGYLMYAFKFNTTNYLNFYYDTKVSSFEVSHPAFKNYELTDKLYDKNISMFSKLSFKRITDNNIIAIAAGMQCFQERESYLQNLSYDIFVNSIQAQGHILWHQIGKKISFSLGSDYIFRRTDSGKDSSMINNYNAIYGEVTKKIQKKIEITFGLRYENNSVISNSIILPRMNLRYKKEKFDVRLDIGTYAQIPDFEYLRFMRSPNYEKANHYIVTLTYDDMERKNFWITWALYQKRYSGLVKYDFIKNHSYNLTNEGEGFARGMDIKLQFYNVFKGKLVATYSYVDSKRLFLDYIEQVQPSFVSKHNFQFKYLKFINRLSTFVNIQYSWASGRPFYGLIDNNGTYISQRLKPYNSINLTIAHLTSIRKLQTILALSFQNILGARNEISCKYVDSLPITFEPMLGRMAYLGIYFYFNKKSKKKIEREIFGYK